MPQGSGSARSRQPLSPPPPGTARKTITRITCAKTLEGTAVTTCAIRVKATQSRSTNLPVSCDCQRDCDRYQSIDRYLRLIDQSAGKECNPPARCFVKTAQVSRFCDNGVSKFRSFEFINLKFIFKRNHGEGYPVLASTKHQLVVANAPPQPKKEESI